MKKQFSAPDFPLSCNRLLLKLLSSGSTRIEYLKKVLKRRIFIREFDYRVDDVYVVTYMKSGTTLLQMVLYQLLTDGDMNFRHIYDVSPWIDQSMVIGKPLPDLPSPRLFKSHSEYKYFPPKVGGKIIYGIRNGMDVAVSMFYHCRDLECSGQEWDEFFNSVFMRKSWFSHVTEWMENKRHFDIFYVRYEDLTQHMRQTAGALASFLGLTPSEEVYQRILERCSFKYMKQYQDKFGMQRPREDRTKYDQFIRKGESGKGQFQFSEAQRDCFIKLYDEHLARYKLGYNFQLLSKKSH
jgi:sulfotransferase family protein